MPQRNSRLQGPWLHETLLNRGGAERFPGMTITYALMQRFEKIAETSDRARIVNKARVFNLLTEGPKQVIGCEYEKAGMAYNECAGGYWTHGRIRSFLQSAAASTISIQHVI